MDMFEIGFYSAVTAYGLIAVWTVLARLRWLPAVFVGLVRRPLNRLGRIPYVGRIVKACRRYPLSLGLVLAIFVGAAVPYFVVSVFWVFQAMLVAVVVGFALRYAGDDEEEEDLSPQAHGLYYSQHGGGRIVPGYDVEADSSRPYLGS